MNHDKLVLLLSGKIGSGKNTLADMLKEELSDKAHLDAFARPLKELCAKAFKPLTTYLNGNVCDVDTIHYESWFEKKTPVTRLILQIVGTDIVRRVDSDYWVKETVKNIEARPEPIIIMTDWRFPGELLGVAKAFPTYTVRVVREMDRSGPEHAHESEIALDFFSFDQTIHNNTSLFALKKNAQALAYTLIEETLH